jgi:hypothetical protein
MQVASVSVVSSRSRRAVGVTDHIWSIGELMETALNGVVSEPVGRKVGWFTVIDGRTK